MKSTFLLVLAAALLATRVAHAGELVLPDSCGSEKVSFDVDTLKNQPQPGPPADGKAKIVFIHTLAKGQMHIGKYVAVRFGIDGAWAGAAWDNSYMSEDVAPGEHKLCTVTQSRFGIGKNFQKSTIKLAKFTAEAGKTYYFEFLLSEDVARVNTSFGTGSAVSYNATFGRLDEDAAEFRLKTEDLATFKTKK